MPKLYIFAIGGTGSRVLRSLTMLLAAGVDTYGHELVPVIIDPDSSNADLTRNVQLLNKYIEVRSHLSFSDGGKNSFFQTPVQQFLPNFCIPIKDTSNKTYEQFIGLGSMSREDEAMAEMLFSQNNLTSSMNVGFKGNPNIGSVVLNQIANSPEFKAVANSFAQGDRIFIISSIFGGTGASGFPLLLKTLRHNTQIPNAGVINLCDIGAISVLPYFALKSNPQSAIDSSTFFSKTRAALKYYQNNVTDANALYYIGDMPTNQYNNNEGGNAQQNDAHLIEVLAATAIIDFCHNLSMGKPTSYRELGLQNQGSTVTLKSLPSATLRPMYAWPLLEFTLMAKSLVEDFDYISGGGMKFSKRFDNADAFYRSPFVSQLRDFLKEYEGWLAELYGNSPSFAPFNMTGNIPATLVDSLEDLVTDVATIKGFFQRRIDTNTFRSALNGVSPKGSSDEDRLMEIYSEATQTFATKHYQL